jgi:hypothetical protein
MYCINTKRLAWHTHSTERRGRRRPGLRGFLLRVSEALGRTGLRAWDYRRFAGLARLTALGARICFGESKPSETELTEHSGPKAA